MKIISKFFLLITLSAVISSCESKKENLLEKLSGIEGTWSMPAGEKPEDGVIIETWVKVNDTLYTGKSYEIINGDSILSETIELKMDHGELYYIPTVMAQNNHQPVLFKMTSNNDDIYIFENPAHDFPNTITYQIQNDSTLKASISGNINGELRAMDFVYTKK